jgi:hypothetical protein
MNKENRRILFSFVLGVILAGLILGLIGVLVL